MTSVFCRRKRSRVSLGHTRFFASCPRMIDFVSTITSSASSMALQEVTNAFLKRMQTSRTPLNRVWTLQCRRYATGEAAAAVEEIEDLEHSSFDNATQPQTSERLSAFDPAAQARKRSKQLPPSRYTHHTPTTSVEPTNHINMNVVDTASARPNTTAAPCTHTNHPPPPTPPPETSSPAPSPYHD